MPMGGTIPTGSARQTGVLYVANSAAIGGGNRVLMDLIAGLDRSRFTPHLIAPFEGPLGEWAARTGVGCRVLPDGDWTGRCGLARRTSRLVMAILQSGARIVHASSHTCYRAAGLAGTLTRALRVCHLGFPPESEELRWSFRFGPDVVIGCHEQQADIVRAQLKAFGSTARTVAIPNAIDLEVFSPRSEDYRKPAWCPPGRLVLIVGHLSEVKGYPTFVDAAARVAAAGEQCTFAALGSETASPGYAQHLSQYVAERGLSDRVRFLGWRNDVADVLRAADIVVLPSLAEGLPLAVLEAMGCGRPVIASSVGGIVDAIDDGVTGLLVPPADAEALALSLLRLLRDGDLADRIGRRAREHAVERFGLSRFAASIRSVYDEFLAPPNQTAHERGFMALSRRRS